MSPTPSNPDEEEEEEEEDYFLPLEDQRVFGAGLKRKRIAFVAAASEDTFLTSNAVTTKTEDAGNRYLAIVMRGDKTNTSKDVDRRDVRICDICKLPLTITEVESESNSNSRLGLTPTSTSTSTLPSTPTVPSTHESSIVHQLCLQHSHPPSHLNREHIGLKYLSNYGWDPDARTGLGARNEGIRAPIKPREKRDTVGLGHGRDEEEEDKVGGSGKTTKRRDKVVKITKVNAKEVRRMEDQKRKKAERLRQSFYGEDLSMYLGPDG